MMEKIWSNFNKIYGYNSREKFESFCKELLIKHFPNKEIFSFFEIQNKKIEKLDNYSVVFVPKFFFDKLTDSRKAQIRSSFNKTKKSFGKLIKGIYAWAVCTPYVLNEDDMKWWLQWKSKNVADSGVNIYFFDGDYLLDLAKKYGLYEKWFDFDKEVQKKVEITDQTQDDLLVFDLKAENEDLNKSEEIITSEDSKEKIQETQAEQHSQENIKKIQPAKKLISSDKNYDYFKQIFKRLNEKIQSLSFNEKKKFDELRKNSLYRYNEMFSGVEILSAPEKDVQAKKKLPVKYWQKAKISQAYHQWEKTLFYLEQLQTIGVYEEVFHQKILKEYEKLLADARRHTEAIIYLFEGDYLLIKEDKERALAVYEKAYKLFPTDKEIKEKYYELCGDIALENNDFAKAKECFELAHTSRYKTEPLIKQKYAEYLHKASKKKGIIPFREMANLGNYLNAERYYKTPYIAEKIANSAMWWFATAVLTVVLILFVLPIFFAPSTSVENHVVQQNLNINELDSFHRYEAFARKYYNLTARFPHVFDTALAYIDSALNLNKKQDLIDLKDLLLNKKREFVQQYQRRILANPEAFLVSMRKPTEGLHFVKMLDEPYNKTKGRYGYIDTNNNIVIPPYFSFDFEKLKGKAPQFKNGKAKVCLELTTGQRAFYIIDKRGNLVKFLEFKSK